MLGGLLINSTSYALILEPLFHYSFIIFLQFVITSEQGILLHAIEQLKKIPLKEQRGPQERIHLKSLQSRIESEKGYQELSFLQSFLLPVKKWADKQLEDYHFRYAEVC